MDLIINKVERKATNYFHFFSYQSEKRNNPVMLISTLNILGDITTKLAELYLVKATYIYDTHLNQTQKEKSEKKYRKETDTAIKLIDMAVNLEPNIKLKKEYMINYIEPCLPDKDEQTYGHQLLIKFPKNITEFVNKFIEDNLIFKRIEKKLGLPEKPEFI